MADIVIKSSLTGNFTIITNEFARNPKVTPRAARVFIYLMSNTEGWVTSAARISKVLEMGEGTVGSALRDLEGLGYLKRERRNVEGGRFRWEYELHAHPVTIDGKTPDGVTWENDANPQVDTIGQKTTSGSATSGNPSDIRRPISKKINPKKNKEEGVFAEVEVTGAETTPLPLEPSSDVPSPADAGTPTPSLEDLARVHAQATPDTWCTADDPRCRDHAQLSRDEVPACRQCGNVRAWFEERERAVVDARRQAVEGCGFCDDRGLVEVEDSQGRPVAALCAHQGPPQPVSGPVPHREVSSASTRRRALEAARGRSA